MSPSSEVTESPLLTSVVTSPRSRPFSTPPCHYLTLWSKELSVNYHHYPLLLSFQRTLALPGKEYMSMEAIDTALKTAQDVSSMISCNKWRRGKFQATDHTVRKRQNWDTNWGPLIPKPQVARPGLEGESRGLQVAEANPLWISSGKLSSFHSRDVSWLSEGHVICLVMKNQCLTWLYQIRDLITETIFLVTALPLILL